MRFFRCIACVEYQPATVLRKRKIMSHCASGDVYLRKSSAISVQQQIVESTQSPRGHPKLHPHPTHPCEVPSVSSPPGVPRDNDTHTTSSAPRCSYIQRISKACIWESADNFILISMVDSSLLIWKNKARTCVQFGPFHTSVMIRNSPAPNKNKRWVHSRPWMYAHLSLIQITDSKFCQVLNLAV